MAFQPIQSLVAAAVERYPDRVAVDGPAGRLTYGELDALAEDVAVSLQRRGVGAGALVPLLIPDRGEFAAALLGVLRIGAVAVPLDPAARRFPSARALTDAAAVVLGAGAGPLAAGLLAHGAVPVDIGAAVGASADGRATHHEPAPDDPCYVFFTSGSTGTPKGIVGRLCAIDHFVRWEVGLLGVRPQWRVSQLVSPAFDAVLRDLFVPLSVGATAVVPPAGTALDPAALARWVDSQRIDLVHCVPSLFRRLLDAAVDNTLSFASLDWVALSGERLAPRDAARWFDRFGERIGLLNLYGPSETTMTKTYHVVTPADTARASIPIGQSMPDTEVLLLDERGAPVADGAVGEIHLRTPYRSLGYHDQPEATRQAFVPGPDGATVYRTGDFGRLLPDGVLEFLGRKDHQVKVGGVRVELGGVEAALREHPEVSDAAVTVVDDESTPYLAAYVELSGELPQDLREHLRDRLPDAAVPAVCVPLAELPRTITGKVDRQALPAPVRTQAPADSARVAPRTATERTVAGIWAAVLPGGAADVRQDFFAAGGTSLLVIELLARLADAFGVSVPLREFLAGPTVETLAALVERALLTADTPDLLGSLT